ncbi:hypothetical protein ScalyP_jg9685 [Parmales sp. scaly parma]|nr:hypothetical protein ScalyP_jg9685 [Parmales sp. scaly parma]
MKISILLLTLTLTTNAFTAPLMATRAIGKSAVATRPVGGKKKVSVAVAPKAKAKAVVAKAPVAVKARPVFGFPKAAAKPAAAPKPVVKKFVAKAMPIAKAKIVAKPKVLARPIAKAAVKPKPKPVVRKPVVRKAKVVSAAAKARKAPPASKGMPSFDTSVFSKVQFKGISGSGIFPRTSPLAQPDFSDPKKNIKRDPAMYKAAAQERMRKLNNKAASAYDDGLSEIERTQKKGKLSSFLTGSAKSQIDKSAIIGEIEAPSFGGLSQDRFQLLFISIFGLFTLVGSLSGAN